jgi:glycosyltransferase involved in cell wall biosynthesis
MLNQIAISIGIPTYNNSATIEQTIYSLREQTFLDWECFICDDSESNETFEAAKLAVSGDPRFTLIRNESRLGAAGNWNKTLSLANGKYFKLLCADDVLLPNALRVQWQALEEHPESVLCTGRRDIINSKGRVVIKSRGLNSRHESMTSDLVIRRFIRTGSNFFGEPSFALYRTKELRDVGGFKSDWSYLIDVVSYLDVLKYGNLSPVDETLGSFRISSTSWSANLSKKQRQENLKCVDYAASLNYVTANSWEMLLGKSRATVSSYIRRAIFKLQS